MPSEYAATRHTVRHSPLTPVIQSHHLPLPSLLRWDAFSSATSEWEERRRLTAYPWDAFPRWSVGTIKAGLQKIADGLNKPRGEKRRDKILERIGRLKEKSRGVSQHYSVDS